MIKSSTKTIYARKLSSANEVGLKYNPLPNTTLNDKFGLLPDAKTINNPILKYYAVGVGGNDVITGNHGYTYSDHMSYDAALFNHVPFVMVEVGADLTPIEQLRYRFKIREVVNGKEYFSYYLKVIDNIDYNDQVYTVNVKSGSKPSLNILSTNTDKFLNPIPKTRTPGSTPLTSDNVTYIANVIKLEFSLSTDELVNLNKAIELKYGTKYKLTEIGVCFGEDSGTEAIGVQIGHHIKIDLNTSIDLANDTNKIVRTIEIGGMEILD